MIYIQYNGYAVPMAVIYNRRAVTVAVIYNGYAVYLCWSCAEPGCSEEERVLILVSWDPVEVGENPEKDTGPESTQSQNIS